MPTQAIPDDVRRLIREHLPSMSHVDVLVALTRAGTPLSLDQVIRRSLASDHQAEACLLALIASGIVESIDSDSELQYRIRPASPPQTLAIQRLAEIANARPVTLVRFVYERPPEKDSWPGSRLLE